MNIKVIMTIENEDGNSANIVKSFEEDDEDIYIPEEIAYMARQLLKGYGYTDDISNDIQSLGWERFARKKPGYNDRYLVSYVDGKYLKTDRDEWDGKKFVKYGDLVVFWAGIPLSLGFWALGG